MEKRKISLKQRMPYSDVVEYLRCFMDGFEKGAILVEKDGERLSLVPTDSVSVEIEAKTKGGKQGFSLDISWESSVGADSSGLSITPAAEPDRIIAVIQEPCETCEPCEAEVEISSTVVEVVAAAPEAAPEAAKPASTAKSAAKPAAKSAAGTKAVKPKAAKPKTAKAKTAAKTAK